MRAPQCPADRLAALVVHADGARGRVGALGDVASIDPRVSGEPASRAFGAHRCGLYCDVHCKGLLSVVISSNLRTLRDSRLWCTRCEHREIGGPDGHLKEES